MAELSPDNAAPTPASSAADPPADHRPSSSSAPLPRPQPAHPVRAIGELPGYSQSLLKIRVPLIVTLASKKQPVNEILGLGPGAIIQFAKSCEEMLDVEVGDRQVAQGEAVKVGDKFGVRITSIVLPGESFVPINRRTG